jgi:hypothetical protein
MRPFGTRTALRSCYRHSARRPGLWLRNDGCAPPESATRTAGSPEWRKHLGQFEEGYFALNPTFAVQQGRHEYDGRLRPTSITRWVS